MRKAAYVHKSGSVKKRTAGDECVAMQDAALLQGRIGNCSPVELKGIPSAQEHAERGVGDPHPSAARRTGVFTSFPAIANQHVRRLEQGVDAPAGLGGKGVRQGLVIGENEDIRCATRRRTRAGQEPEHGKEWNAA